MTKRLKSSIPEVRPEQLTFGDWWQVVAMITALVMGGLSFAGILSFWIGGVTCGGGLLLAFVYAQRLGWPRLVRVMVFLAAAVLARPFLSKYRDLQQGPVSISPEVVSVPGEGWTRPTVVSIVNHEERPRYGATVEIERSSADVTYTVEGLQEQLGGALFGFSDGSRLFPIPRIGPKGVYEFSIKSRTNSKNRGHLNLSISPGSPDESGTPQILTK